VLLSNSAFFIFAVFVVHSATVVLTRCFKVLTFFTILLHIWWSWTPVTVGTQFQRTRWLASAMRTLLYLQMSVVLAGVFLVSTESRSPRRRNATPTARSEFLVLLEKRYLSRLVSFAFTTLDYGFVNFGFLMEWRLRLQSHILTGQVADESIWRWLGSCDS